MRNPILRRLAAAVAAPLLLVSVWAGPASAGKPAHQACIGHDFSTYATGGAAFGAFVMELASNTGGIGDEVQAHQAGLVPDEVIPNTCND